MMTSNEGPGESLYFLDENGTSIPISNNRLGSGNTFTISFGGATGSAIITVKTYFPNTDNGFVNETATLNVTLRLITPSQPVSNDGNVILGCSAGEEVSVRSLPALTNTAQDCYYHCSPEWSAPAGWTLQNCCRSGNPLSDLSTFDDTKLTFPGGLSGGNQGLLTITARYSVCDFQQNTASSSRIWYGTPNLRDPTVNGSPAQSFNTVGSSAYLTVQSDAISSYTWTIVGGNGYIYPGYNSCNVSVNGFVRVEARANNRCGNGATYTFYLSSGSGYRVAPNPATEQVSVEFESSELATDAMTGMALFNEKGKEVKRFDTAKAKSDKSFKDTKAVKLDVNELPRGTYFLHIYYGEQVRKSQIVLE